MTAEPGRRMSVEEYLAFERQSEGKHEYLDGEVFAMTGASRQHNRISWNIVGALDPQLRDGGCEGFVGDMRLRIPDTGLYTYPDVVVVCGEPRFDDQKHLDTLLNPTLVIEVLSPSTEDYDRGRKFAHYRTLETLKMVLFVAQDRVHVEVFARQPDNSWILTETDRLEDTLDLPAIGANLPLAQVYSRVPGVTPV